MEYQSLLNAGLVLISSVTGWFARELWTAVKELKIDLAKLREDLPKEYISKDDYKEDIRELKKMIEKIFDKLDNKSDRV
jgi:hypothetical protein